MSIFVGPSADYWARIVGEENTAAYEDTEQFDLWVNARLTHPWIEKLSKHG
jgi:hypothetical protein